ncbi:MAG TPA: tetratricopeptide repeat protein, partial [Prosthecobacter sp.]|nr:tetratricopeptide repeat protein [Prosthecobacter sp.]
MLAILHISASCAMIGTAHAHGAYHDAVTQIQSALKQTPNDPALHFRLACAHHEHGEWEAALVETERVDRLEPGRYPTDLVRGQALAAGGHWSAAKTVFDRFLIGQPDHSVALAQRAKVLLKLEQTSAALADYRGAVAKGTPEADLFIEAADALATHGSLDEAVTLLRRAIAECGNVPSLLLRSLDHELAAKNFDEALARVAALQGGAPR